MPTNIPTNIISQQPTVSPTITPTCIPTILPTFLPTNLPSKLPTVLLTTFLTFNPTKTPVNPPKLMDDDPLESNSLLWIYSITMSIFAFTFCGLLFYLIFSKKYAPQPPIHHDLNIQQKIPNEPKIAPIKNPISPTLVNIHQENYQVNALKNISYFIDHNPNAEGIKETNNINNEKEINTIK